MSSEQNKNTRDFVDYQPEVIKLLSQEEFEIAGKYGKILSGLRDKIMTVKEIHDLYLVESDNDSKLHSVTQQSVYRYLEDLEKSGLIMVVGYRKTEGVKASERIYGRTAKIFVTSPITEIREIQDENERSFVERLAKIIAIALNVDLENLNLNGFTQFYQKYDSLRAISVKNLYEKAKTNKSLSEIFSTMSIEQINESMWYIQQFVPFIQNPEILMQLKSLYD